MLFIHVVFKLSKIVTKNILNGRSDNKEKCVYFGGGHDGFVNKFQVLPAAVKSFQVYQQKLINQRGTLRQVLL